MDQSQFDQVIQDVEGGLTLGKALAKIPTSYNVFYRFCDKDLARRVIVARARENGAFAIVDEAVEIADTAADPQLARVRADVRFKFAAAHAPRTFGAKIDLNVIDASNPAALDQEGRQRVRLLRDPAALLTLQPIEDAEVLPESATGKQPDVLIPADVRGTIFE